MVCEVELYVLCTRSVNNNLNGLAWEIKVNF
jgi:hypothetical protein